MRHSGDPGDGFGGGSGGRATGPDAGAPETGYPDDDVLLHLEVIHAAVAGLRAVNWWARSDQAAREGVHQGSQVLASLEACLLTQVADLDSRPDAFALSRPDAVARTFLRHKLNRTPSQAGADLRAALTLTKTDPATGGLPQLAAVFAAGLRLSLQNPPTATPPPPTARPTLPKVRPAQPSPGQPPVAPPPTAKDEPP